MSIIFDDINLISLKNESLYDSGYIKGEIGDADVEFVTFSGGGMSSAGFAGVLKDMEERGKYIPKKSISKGWLFDPLDKFYFIDHQVKYWIGSSAGAIICGFAALGAPSEFIIELILNTDARIFLDYGGRDQTNLNWWSKMINYGYGFIDIFRKWGMIHGKKFKEWYAEQMLILGWNPNTTFEELYDLTGQHVIITATSLNTFETLYLSRTTQPKMKLLDAIDMSIRFPCLFPPIFMDDLSITQGQRIITDGGILDDLPINACDVISRIGELLAINRKAIGFTLINDGKWVPDYVKIDGLLKYSLTFVESMHRRMHVLQSCQSYFWDRVVPIETHGVDTLDFEIDKDKLKKTIESGRKASKRFFDDRAEMIKTYGPLPQNLFIPNPKLRYNGIEYLSDELISNTAIYGTNPSHFSWNKLPIERCFSC